MSVDCRPCDHANKQPHSDCRVCFLFTYEPSYRKLWTNCDGKPVKKTPPTRKLQCVHLGERTEFRPGCNGWLCKHKCEAGQEYAMPGGICQTCEKYDPEG